MPAQVSATRKSARALLEPRGLGVAAHLAMTTTKTEPSKLDQVTTKAKDGLETVSDTARDVAEKVADGAKTLLDGAKQTAKDAKRAVRDAVLHTNDKLEDLKDKLD
jgi:hypothetical protein